MRKFMAIPMAAMLAVSIGTPATAQTWRTINQRQALLDARIDTGIRSGALTRQEAIVLRGQFRTLANLEANYRRTGNVLTLTERRDLDRRFEALSARVRTQRTDAQTAAGWRTINQRQALLESRITLGIRNRTVTQREAILLRGQFRTLATLEASYRRSGNVLTLTERQDLDRRFDALSKRIRISRTN